MPPPVAARKAAPPAGSDDARRWNWSVWRWCWRFSLSPCGSQASGDRPDRFPIVHLSPLDSGDAPTASRTHGLLEPMILDIARLMLFPALMAFAAASDLFTMTISNRVSLALVAGFLVLAPAERHGPARHPRAYRRRRRRARGRRSPALRWAGSAAAMPRSRPRAALWFGFDHLLELSALCLAVRRRADIAAAAVPAVAAALPASPARPGCSGCTPRRAEFPTASRSRSAR